MDGVQKVPIAQAPQASGGKEGRLNQQGSTVRLRLGLKLEPGLARNLHLGPQAEQSVRLHGLDAPEIQRFTHAQLVGIAATATKTHATHQTIGDAA